MTPQSMQDKHWGIPMMLIWHLFAVYRANRENLSAGSNICQDLIKRILRRRKNVSENRRIKLKCYLLIILFKFWPIIYLTELHLGSYAQNVSLNMLTVTE